MVQAFSTYILLYKKVVDNLNI